LLIARGETCDGVLSTPIGGLEIRSGGELGLLPEGLTSGSGGGTSGLTAGSDPLGRVEASDTGVAATMAEADDGLTSFLELGEAVAAKGFTCDGGS
jgi:hypothetical protein